MYMHVHAAKRSDIHMYMYIHRVLSGEMGEPSPLGKGDVCPQEEMFPLKKSLQMILLD